MMILLAGRRGQMQVGTKLVFKGADSYRQDQTTFWLWADVTVAGEDRVPLPGLGRAVVADPVCFYPPQPNDYGLQRVQDPWMRGHHKLTLDLDYRQLDEIESKRKGGPLTFTFRVGGRVMHGGRVGSLNPSNHQLTYDIGTSDWIRLLGQMGYGQYLTVEIPMTAPGQLTDAVRSAAEAVERAQGSDLRKWMSRACSDLLFLV
jgi:hypothetical protein